MRIWSILVVCALITSAYVASSFAAETIVGGQYRVMTNVSNFGWHQTTVSEDEDANVYINQRFRMNLNSTFDGHARAHVQLEFGHNTWGDGVGTKTISRDDGDDIGIELRHAYLDFDVRGIGIKAGIQDWSDGFGDVLASGDWDYNAGGVMVSKRADRLNLKVGMLKLWEGDSREDDDSDLYAVDVDVTPVGFHLYFLNDKSVAKAEETNLWAGVSVKREVGPATVDGAVIYNQGSVDGDGGADLEHAGYAVKAACSAEAGSADLGVQVLYSTGDDGKSGTDTDEFRTLQADGQGYWSYVGLFTPRGPSDTNNLRASLRNRDQNGIPRGLTTVQARCSYPVREDLSFYAAAGVFQASVDDGKGKGMGTEVLAEGKYMISKTLGIEFGGSVAILGDFYKKIGSEDSPNNLYELYSRLQVEF